MLSVEQFFGFLLAASVITIAPGPDNMMVLSIGIGLGCALGCLSHTLLAVLGVSALIAASAEAFTALKVCGGLYLIWLGITFTAQAALTFGLLGYFSGTVGQWLNASPRIGLALDRLTGVIFVGLGLRLIVSR